MGYMDNYYLDRESLDTLSELTFTAKGAKNPLMSLPAKAKTTFTRQ
jgi:replication factor C subunit 1